MLRKISLENFKNWRELEIELAPISLLFGINSAGKTGVLQSLLLLKQTARGFDPRQHLNFGGGDRDYTDFGSYQDLVHGHDQTRHLGISLSWDVPDGQFGMLMMTPEELHTAITADDLKRTTLSYDIRWKLDKDIFIERLGYSAILKEAPEFFARLIRRDDEKYALELSESFYDSSSEHEDAPSIEPGGNEASEDESVESPASCYMIPYSAIPSRKRRSMKVAPFMFNFEFERLMESFYYLGPLRQYPRRYYQWTGDTKSQVLDPDGADTIRTLVSSERDDRSLQQDVAEWLSRLELVQALKVKSTDRNRRFYEVTVEVDGVESALVDVGFGVSQVLPVVTLLFSAPRGSTVLLEQPELHLHPNAQSLLADLMLYVAENRNLQLIVESHSEHILRRLQRRIAETELEFAKPDNIKMYFCEPGKGGSKISEVEVDRFGQISNWPEKFFGDISGDLHTMVKSALNRRRTELENA
ncbi:MAG: DUF3696 domain-containing protein [Chloroflexota bacterium]|nr:DUF3696 domain-containing protein [Chloroflexota bacterium]